MLLKSLIALNSFSFNSLTRRLLKFFLENEFLNLKNIFMIIRILLSFIFAFINICSMKKHRPLSVTRVKKERKERSLGKRRYFSI